MVNFGPLAAEIGPVVWGTPANFNGFRVLAALLHGSQVVGVSQTLHRWTEGTTFNCSSGRWSRWALAHILVHWRFAVKLWWCGNHRTLTVVFGYSWFSWRGALATATIKTSPRSGSVHVEHWISLSCHIQCKLRGFTSVVKTKRLCYFLESGSSLKKFSTFFPREA